VPRPVEFTPVIKQDASSDSLRVPHSCHSLISLKHLVEAQNAGQAFDATLNVTPNKGGPSLD